MFNFFKKIYPNTLRGARAKFPTLLFVSASIAAILLVPLLLALFKSVITAKADARQNKSRESHSKKRGAGGDPLITVTPAFLEAAEKKHIQ
ncbi:hypothetical protein HY798_04435 [Candidatus Falkowbacteria bacterium]|nr:hypothetical protein [Candidatus Falkowbacteria bacterium]